MVHCHADLMKKKCMRNFSSPFIAKTISRENIFIQNVLVQSHFIAIFCKVLFFSILVNRFEMGRLLTPRILREANCCTEVIKKNH